MYVYSARGPQVIVSESVHQRQHADFLARHIGKFEDIIRDLEAPVAAATVAPAAKAAVVY